ncbi:pheophorbidase-like isoform X2 [Brassica napus]|uniref:pheophorbidase isoform X2 n=1 Tax=Brassica napus TaxID=3708 RepID=UPI002078E8EA|nr:pheophorbidase isoform X2 [Brassica napus]XP_048595038.1 pheophorbidase-like isoform X2 [Brassica napus]
MGGDGGDEPIIHFVLVHGACHGAWCWYRLTTLLLSAGFKATTVDLTSAGINLTDANTVFEFDHYNRPLFSLLSDIPHHHKIILVGHSIGGASVTAALCKFSDKISMAVYLVADMVQPGTTSPPHSIMSVGEEEDIWEFTYGEGDDSQSPLEDVILASKLLRPSPVRALRGIDKLPPNPEAERVPRVYIKTAKDNLCDPILQDRMVEKWPPSQLYTLEESDHSAFFSVPTTLFTCLIRAVFSPEL